MARNAPVWVELELVGDRDSLRWFEPTIEPWESFERPQVRWSDIAELLQLLGIRAPDARPGDIVTESLRVLPLVYTLGVRRALAELRTAGDAVCLFPLIGFQEPSPDRLRAWMTRVNVAVVSDWVFTLRLPDRSWPLVTPRPLPTPAGTLVVRERFLPCAGQPTAQQLGEAIGLYQAATCGAIVGRGRSWLGEIESRFMAPAATVLESESLERNFHQLFRLGVRAEELERELTRLVGRFDGGRGVEFVDRLQGSFAEARHAVRSFQQDLRQSGDGIASMAASQQLALAERHREIAEEQQTATQSFQRRATIVGAAVLIPALVAGVFGANVDLPGRDESRGLASMLFFMAGLGVGTWWGIVSLDHPEARLTALPWQPRFAHVHAGFFIAVVCLAFGVLTLTPAVDEASLTGIKTAAAIAAVATIGLGLAGCVWCWLNGPSRSDWWAERGGKRRATRLGRLVAPAVVVTGVVLVIQVLL